MASTVPLDEAWTVSDDEFCRATRGRLLRVYHCTRLTEREIGEVRECGLVPLNPNLVARRIENAVVDGHLTPDEGVLYSTSRLSHDPERRGRLWFCGDRLSVSNVHGVGYLFSIWGGEGINMAWDSRSEECRRLARVGTPSVVISLIDPTESSGSHPGLFAAALNKARGGTRGTDVCIRVPVTPANIEAIEFPGSRWWRRYVRWEPSA
jgi:hypothetical protein